jgi:class 3 adenylate cyclase
MMAGLAIDLFSFVAVCGLLTGVWVLTSGSSHDLSRVAADPTLSVKLGFWPVWVILAWGAALVIHLGVVLSLGLFGSRARRRRRRIARHAARAATHLRDHTAAATKAAAARHQTSAEVPPEPERRWVTVMFTDIADSTRLTESLGDGEWSKVLGGHRELVRSLALGRGGEVVGTQGDGLLVRFPTPAEAVLCAVDLQRDLNSTRRESHFDLRVRVGIHAGEAVQHDDGDLIGRVVNVAARVTAATEPGEILVTEPVADYLGGRLSLEDRGLRDLRGFDQPRHLLAVRWEDEGKPVESR